MRTTRVAALGMSTVVAVAGLAGLAGSSTAGATGSGHGGTTAGRFTHPRQNLYFPLRPGTVTRYRGTEDREHFTERVVVTARTRTIQGVHARVVSDVLRRADGTLAEKTQDWY